MKCSRERCGGVLYKSRGDYKYVECGLSNVLVLNGRIWLCDRCNDRYHDLPDWRKANPLITRELLRVPRPLCGEEIDFLAHELRLKTVALKKFLRASWPQMNAWIKGVKRIDSHRDQRLRLKVAELFSNQETEVRNEIRQLFNSGYDHCETKRRVMILEERDGKWVLSTKDASGR